MESVPFVQKSLEDRASKLAGMWIRSRNWMQILVDITNPNYPSSDSIRICFDMHILDRM